MTETKQSQTFKAKLIRALFRKVTGRSDAENGLIWTFHYFCHRSAWRAYLHTLMFKGNGKQEG